MVFFCPCMIVVATCLSILLAAKHDNSIAMPATASDNFFTISGGNVIEVDNGATNGVIHVIDVVLS